MRNFFRRNKNRICLLVAKSKEKENMKFEIKVDLPHLLWWTACLTSYYYARRSLSPKQQHKKKLKVFLIFCELASRLKILAFIASKKYASIKVIQVDFHFIRDSLCVFLAMLYTFLTFLSELIFISNRRR